MRLFFYVQMYWYNKKETLLYKRPPNPIPSSVAMCLPLNSEIKLTYIVSVRQQMKSVHLFNYNTDVSKLVRYIALIIAWPVNYVKFSLLKRKLKLINTSHARYIFFLSLPFFYIVISRLILKIYICYYLLLIGY